MKQRGWFYYTSAIVCGILLGLAWSGAVIAIQKLYEPPLMPHASDQETP